MTGSGLPRAALDRANEVRLARAEARRELGGLLLVPGLLRLAEMVEDPPVEMVSAKVFRELLWVRGMGPVRRRKLWRRVGRLVPESRTFGAMTPRQRRAEAAALRAHAEEVRVARWRCRRCRRMRPGGVSVCGQCGEGRP